MTKKNVLLCSEKKIQQNSWKMKLKKKSQKVEQMIKEMNNEREDVKIEKQFRR